MEGSARWPGVAEGDLTGANAQFLTPNVLAEKVGAVDKVVSPWAAQLTDGTRREVHQ